LSGGGDVHVSGSSSATAFSHHTLQGTFEDKSYIHLVMEVCEGGELFDRIAEKGHFSEKQVRPVRA
jgi:serine/threonine protein kinase